MFNKENFKWFIFLSTVFFYSCNPFLTSKKKSVCGESIRVSIFDSLINETITDYELYEVTSFPEGIIMKLQAVKEHNKYKDSLGITCLPLTKEYSSKMIRKFVLVKDEYVYTEYHLKNRIADTLLKAIKLKPRL